MPTFGDRLAHAWNAFMNKDPTPRYYTSGGGSSIRPDRFRLRPTNERTIINAIENRIALDVASIDIRHVRLDNNGRYVEDISSNFNEVLSLSSNVDQTSRAFFQDLVMSMFDEGCVAAIPTKADYNINLVNSFDIEAMRVGKITQWFPNSIQVQVYNEDTGKKEFLTLPKNHVAIIENPFYSVMNEPNSTLRRLVHKLNLLDAVDEETSSGKLDIIVQLPYTIKSELRKQQAEERRKDIEMQLSGTKYGIAYIDGTEKVTQLNRSLDNQLMGQIEYLTSMLYSQLAITEEILKGTADEQTMLNYYNRTVEPILAAIVDEFKRKFLTKTARTQKQSVIYIRNPFKLVPVNNIADIADKFTRNEILSSNEVRGLIGYRPVNDPQADELRNKNINQSDNAEPPASTEDGYYDENGDYGDGYTDDEEY